MLDFDTREFYCAMGAVHALTRVMLEDHGIGSAVAYNLMADGIHSTDDIIAVAAPLAQQAGDDLAKKYRACIHIAEYVKAKS